MTTRLNRLNRLRKANSLSGRGRSGLRTLLFDDFERADTSAGDLGTSPTGQEWDMRGGVDGSYPPLPVSSFGQIIGGSFVVPGGQVVYAFASLDRAPRQVTVDWSWVDDTTGTQFTTLALVVTSPPVENYIANMLHITVTNGVCRIQKRVNGQPTPWPDLNSGATSISPSLALANTVHRLVLDIDGDTARVRIDGDRFDQTVTDSEISDLVGNVVGFEHFSGSTDVRYPMAIRSVEARG